MKQCKYCIDFFADDGNLRANDIVKGNLPGLGQPFYQGYIAPGHYLKKDSNMNFLMHFDNGYGDGIEQLFKFNYCPMCGRKLVKEKNDG